MTSIKEFAEQMSTSEQIIRRHLRSGRIQGTKKANKYTIAEGELSYALKNGFRDHSEVNIKDDELAPFKKVLKIAGVSFIESIARDFFHHRNRLQSLDSRGEDTKIQKALVEYYDDQLVKAIKLSNISNEKLEELNLEDFSS